MKHLLILMTIVLLALSFALPTALSAQAADPEAVIRAVGKALNAGDLDAVMAYYADNAVKTQQPPPAGQSGTWTGKDEIRASIKSMMDAHTSCEAGNVQVAGNKVSYTATCASDTFRKLGLTSIAVNEETTVEAGKITVQHVTIPPETLAKIQAAAASQTPQALPTTGAASSGTVLPALALGVLGVLAGLGMRLRRRGVARA